MLKKDELLTRAYLYTDACEKRGEKITWRDDILFPDGTNMGGWVQKRLLQLKAWNQHPETLQINQLYDYAIATVLQVYLEKRFSKVARLERKMMEYQEACTMIGREITRTHDVKFSNGKSMGDWKIHQLQRLKKLLTMNDLNEEEVKEKDLLLNFFQEIDLRYGFHRHLLEYKLMCIHQNKKISRDSKECFTGGVHVGNWIGYERKQIKKIRAMENKTNLDERKISLWDQTMLEIQNEIKKNKVKTNV